MAPPPPSAFHHDGVRTWCTWHHLLVNFTIFFFLDEIDSLLLEDWLLSHTLLHSAYQPIWPQMMLPEMKNWEDDCLLCACMFFHPAECIVYFIFILGSPGSDCSTPTPPPHPSTITNPSLHLTSSEAAQLGQRAFCPLKVLGSERHSDACSISVSLAPRTGSFMRQWWNILELCMSTSGWSLELLLQQFYLHLLFSLPPDVSLDIIPLYNYLLGFSTDRLSLGILNGDCNDVCRICFCASAQIFNMSCPITMAVIVDVSRI